MPKKYVDNFLYEEESYKIRGACFSVYNALGGGIREKTVEKALEQELATQGLQTKTQVRIDLFYRRTKIGTYVPDLVVEDKIVIELKSKPFLTKKDKKQFWGYLKQSPYCLGFLVNFASRQLVIQRFAHTKKSA